MIKIISVVGARPNFMKIAPIHRELQKFIPQVNHLICHTGQHYEEKMSKVFFNDLQLPKPDYYLGVGSGSHAVQTAKIMIEFEKVLIIEKPDLIIVVGDVNSTIACTLVAKKMGIKIAHIEAGLRSFDMNMPEEINSILTDRISDYLFVTEQSGLENLKNEGIDNNKVYFVGNTMIDSLIYYQNKISQSNFLDKSKLKKNEYVLVTFHRPSIVDNEESLKKLIGFLNKISRRKKVIFPIHPRTMSSLKEFSLDNYFSKNIILTEPIGYIDFQDLVKNTSLVITDSGGIQEETTFLGIQCITLRTTTERPITVDIGTNQLIGVEFEKAEKASLDVLSGNKKEGKIPKFWDGKSAERITNILLKTNSNQITNIK